MQFKDVPGNIKIINRLIESAEKGRIAHAQMIIGSQGCGKLILALAYAKFLNCSNKVYYNDGEIKADSCGECSSCKKFESLQHPDLHFLFPIVNKNKKELSLDFITEWREYLEKKSGIVGLNSWYDFIQVENSQGFISVDNINDVLSRLYFKNLEAKIKVIVIWMAEKIQYKAAPKLLKTLEEPAENTLFLLITENADTILPTVMSRMQSIRMETPSLQDCFVFLKNNFSDFSNDDLYNAVYNSNRDLDKAIDYLHKKNDLLKVNSFFVDWMRVCYTLDGHAILNISKNFADIGREKQKYYLSECAIKILKAFHISNEIGEEKFFDPKEEEFFKNFSKYIKKEGINSISYYLDEAIKQIERNGNPKLIFKNLSFDVGRLFRT